MNEHKITISVYSSISPSKNPEKYQMDFAATARSLMYAYLQRHKMELVDPNLISVWRIDNSSESEFNFDDGVSCRLGTDDRIINSEQLLKGEFKSFYLAFERGVQISVTVDIDKSKTTTLMLIISTLATASAIIKLIHDHIPKTKQLRLNLRHKIGILKGNENIVSLIKYSKSYEFFIDINGSLQYDKYAKEEIVKRLKSEYDRMKSDSFRNKSENNQNINLSRTLYHENQQNHRRLPEIAGKTQDIQLEISSEDNFYQENQRRSLPLIPLSTTPSSITYNNYSKYVENLSERENTTADKEHPPEPILRTNLLLSDKSSSTASTVSISDNNSIKEEITFRPSSIPDSNVTTSAHSAPNLFQIVKYFDLVPIDFQISPTSARSSNIINLNEKLFKDVVAQLDNNPRGPNPILGSENSAFKAIETTLKLSVLILDNDYGKTSDNGAFGLCKGDILVEINGENALGKSMKYINQKLSTTNRHSLVVAKLKSKLTNDNKQKDEKINKLKHELETLKRMYSDLNHVTVTNDKLIQQLTQVLKKQTISSNMSIFHT